MELVLTGLTEATYRYVSITDTGKGLPSYPVSQKPTGKRQYIDTYRFPAPAPQSNGERGLLPRAKTGRGSED